MTIHVVRLPLSQRVKGAVRGAGNVRDGVLQRRAEDVGVVFGVEFAKGARGGGALDGADGGEPRGDARRDLGEFEVGNGAVDTRTLPGHAHQIKGAVGALDERWDTLILVEGQAVFDGELVGGGARAA